MKQGSDNTPIILVIEDNILMLKLIGRILNMEGWRAILAADSRYGMAMMDETDPDLVRLDIRMPDIDGFETLKMIREKSNVPVIMVTANWDPDVTNKAFSMGADDYVRKPFSNAELVARIRAKLRRV